MVLPGAEPGIELQAELGFARAAELSEGLCERIVGFREGRIERDGLMKRGAGFGPAPLAKADQPQIVVELRVIRREGEPAFIP